MQPIVLPCGEETLDTKCQFQRGGLSVYCATGEPARHLRCRYSVQMNRGKKIDAVEFGDVIVVRTAQTVMVDVVVRDETQDQWKLEEGFITQCT